MGCNAWNHHPDCTCGWGGDGHLGKRSGQKSFQQKHVSYREKRETVVSNESGCHPSRCPKCGDNVFFVRHNGGSVWLDPPLSPPWYKHACFNYENTRVARGSVKKHRENGFVSDQSYLGVVVRSEYSDYYDATSISLEVDCSIVCVSCRGDARRLIGELCILDPLQREIWGTGSPDKFYNCLGRLSEKEKPIKKCEDIDKKKDLPLQPLVRCFICKVALKPTDSRLKKHYKKVHNCSVVSYEGKVTGIMIFG